MDEFTYSSGAHYASGGGAGGQNYIYLSKNCEKKIIEFTTVTEFTKFTNGILNSKLIQKYIIDGQYNQLSTAKIADIPFISLEIINKNNLYTSIIERANSLSEHYVALDRMLFDFSNYLQVKFSVSLNKSILDKSFDLIEVFSKNKIKLSISEEAEWLKYFNEEKWKVQKLTEEIDKTDKEIDQMVYELYGLTENEIKVVEESNA